MQKLKTHKTVEQIAKKHGLDASFIQKQLDIGEPIEHEHTQDHDLAKYIALQHLNEIPDYYTRLKKMEADAKKSMKEETKSGDEGLHDWFNKSKSSDGKKGWVQLGGKWAGKPCARQPGQTSTPKCGSSKMKKNLNAGEEEAARERKNRQDPNQPQKTGSAKPTNVRTEEMNLQEVKDKPSKGSGKKDACYNKVKSRYDVWPSAYASGALVKCRKVGAANWGTKSEETHPVLNGKNGEEQRYCPLCKKRETRSECSYGEKAWDRVSVKDEEYSMVRSELSTIVDAVRRLKIKVERGEGNLEAWVQSKITKAADYIDTAADYVMGGEMDEACWDGYKQVGMKKKGKKMVPNCVPEETVNEATRIQSSTGNILTVIINWKGKNYSLKMFFPQVSLPSKSDISYEIQKIYPGSKVIYHRVSEASPGEPLVMITSTNRSKNYLLNNKTIGEDWQKVNRQDKTDGLSPAAVKAYRRENPGSKLQTAVTEKNPEGKRAKRRASFCRRMKGMKSKLTSAKTSRDPDSRINKALRRWNCN
jgi:hypothetical protein